MLKKKDKYWEKQIPDNTKFRIENFILSPTFDCLKTGLELEQDPNPKNVFVYIVEETKIEIHEWLKENKILLCNWERGYTEDEITYQYVFRFKTLTDAMAFKLKWI